MREGEGLKYISAMGVWYTVGRGEVTMRLHCHSEIHLWWVKSLRDEIRPWQVKSSLREGDGLPMAPSGRELAP